MPHPVPTTIIGSSAQTSSLLREKRISSYSTMRIRTTTDRVERPDITHLELNDQAAPRFRVGSLEYREFSHRDLVRPISPLRLRSPFPVNRLP